MIKIQSIKKKATDACLIAYGGCHKDGYCLYTADSFNCTCKDGYEGDGFNCTGTITFFFLFSFLFVSLLTPSKQQNMKF